MREQLENFEKYVSKFRKNFESKVAAYQVADMFLWESDSWKFGEKGLGWLKGASKGVLNFAQIKRMKGLEPMDISPEFTNFMKAFHMHTLCSASQIPSAAVFNQELMIMKRWFYEMVLMTGQTHPMYLTSEIVHSAIDRHAKFGAPSAVSDSADKSIKITKMIRRYGFTLVNLDIQNQYSCRNTTNKVQDLDPSKTDDEHLISIRAFMAVIELIHLTESNENKLLMHALLLSIITGFRFQETRLLQVDSLIRREITDRDKKKNALERGFPTYYLGIEYMGAKKSGRRIHWLAPSTYPVVEMIYEQVRSLTEHNRNQLQKFRLSEFKNFLPDEINALPYDEIESRQLVNHVFAGTGGTRKAISKSFCTSMLAYGGHKPRVVEVRKQLKNYFFTKNQLNDYIQNVYRAETNFSDGHQCILTHNDQGKFVNYKFEDLLFIGCNGYGNVNNDFRSLMVIRPFKDKDLDAWLGNRGEKRSIFQFYGLFEDDGSEIVIRKHSVRHNINTFLAIAGVTEHLQAILMGRIDISQNKHYQHCVESIEYRAASMAMVTLEQADTAHKDPQLLILDDSTGPLAIVKKSGQTAVSKRMAAYAKSYRSRSGIEAVKKSGFIIHNKTLSTEHNLKCNMQTYGGSSDEIRRYLNGAMSESFLPELKEAHDRLINKQQLVEAKRLLNRHSTLYPLVFGACTRNVANWGCPFAMRCQDGSPCGYFSLSGRAGETEELIVRLERKQAEVEILRSLNSNNPTYQVALDEQEQSLMLYESFMNKTINSFQASELVSLLSDDKNNPLRPVLKTIQEQTLIGKTPTTLADLFYIEQKRIERDAEQ